MRLRHYQVKIVKVGVMLLIDRCIHVLVGCVGEGRGEFQMMMNIITTCKHAIMNIIYLCKPS